jgi:hypothetical protein
MRPPMFSTRSRFAPDALLFAHGLALAPAAALTETVPLSFRTQEIASNFIVGHARPTARVPEG